MGVGSGPLAGVQCLEVGGIGPAPFAGMMLADLGADVVRIDRRDAATPGGEDPLRRGKRSIMLDIKNPLGMEAVLRAVQHVDVLIEGFRPGVMERLGIGPGVCLQRNGRLVYGRMTAFGQEGPYAGVPAHDVNCLALSGILAAVGLPDGPPVIPLNIIGDFGAGGLLLAYGVVCALIEASRSGRGQVVDAAMLDGLTLLMAGTFAMLQNGTWRPERGRNLLDGGAPFYNVYRTLDDRYVSVGAMEPKFLATLLRLCGIECDTGRQYDRAGWPELTARLRALFATRTREEWEEFAARHETCLAPVLEMAEVPDHPQLRARRSFLDVGGLRQPSPAPRFSRTPGAVRSTDPAPGTHTSAVLDGWGFSQEEVTELYRGGAAGDFLSPSHSDWSV